MDDLEEISIKPVRQYNFPEDNGWIYFIKDENKYKDIKKYLESKGWEDTSFKNDFQNPNIEESWRIIHPVLYNGKKYFTLANPYKIYPNNYNVLNIQDVPKELIVLNEISIKPVGQEIKFPIRVTREEFNNIAPKLEKLGYKWRYGNEELPTKENPIPIIGKYQISSNKDKLLSWGELYESKIRLKLKK